MTNNQQFTITARPSDIDPAERRRRLAAVYAILLDAAARVENAQQSEGNHDSHTS